MSTPASFSEVARAHLSLSWQSSGEPLDGFPVRALLDHYLTALDQDQASTDEAAMLACRVLSDWVARLRAEIAAHSPATCDICVRLNQRLAATRDALADLHARLLVVERLRKEAAHEPARADGPPRKPMQ